jgi:hypothetical protein
VRPAARKSETLRIRGLLTMTTPTMKARTAATMPQSIQVRFKEVLLASSGVARGREFYMGRG